MGPRIGVLDPPCLPCRDVGVGRLAHGEYILGGRGRGVRFIFIGGKGKGVGVTIFVTGDVTGVTCDVL